MSGSSSPYYPPRSRWYSPLRYQWFRCCRAFSSLWVLCEHRISIGTRAMILSILIPGFVFRVLGYRKIATLCFCSVGVALAIYFVWLGYPAATLAYSFILFLHVTSLTYLNRRLCPEQHVISRLFFTLGILLALNVMVYGFLQNRLLRRIVPLRIGKNVIVINAGSTRNIHRGEWIAYRIQSDSSSVSGAGYHGSIIAHQGFGIEPALAIPRDTIQFGELSFSVNGKSYPNPTYMPKSGQMTLSEKQWLVFPKFAIAGGGMPEGEIARFLIGFATIEEKDIVGRPFKRWFWREQKLP